MNKNRLLEYLIVTNQVDECLGLKKEKEKSKPKELKYSFNSNYQYNTKQKNNK